MQLKLVVSLGFLLLPSASLAAEKWALVVDLDPSLKAADAAKAALKAKVPKFVDATATSRAVDAIRGGMFGNLDAPMPSGWPAALKKSWTDGVAACKQRQGELSGGMKAPGSAGQLMEGQQCAHTLSVTLWNLWLKDQKITKSIELTAGAPKDGQADLTATLSTMANDEMTMVKSSVPVADAPKAAADAVTTLLTGGGQKGKRYVATELPKGLSASLSQFQSWPEEKDLPAIPLRSGCTSAPSGITVEPASRFASTLTGRYAASAKGASGAPLSCKLDGTTSKDSMMGMTIVIANLTCGAKSYRAEAADVTMKATPADALSKKLIEAIFSASCSK